MELEVIAAGQGVMQLQQAILLYGSRESVKHASVHSVHERDGVPMIGAGVTLTREALERAMTDLVNGSGAQTWRFIDDSVIASGTSLLAWWTPERERYMHFAEHAGIKSGAAKQPPLLWVVRDRKLSIYALPTNERPTPQTKVCAAPFYNVWRSGLLCVGNAPTPKQLESSLWEAMFYDSMFTHPNDGAGWHCSHRGGVKALWARLVREAGKKPFPMNVLKATGETVEDVISRGEKGA